MIIYEVNLTVESQIANSFKTWLQGHIREMLTFEGFQRAIFLELSDQETNSASLQYKVHYFIETRAHLQNYFRKHAERMREVGLALFKGKFTATREILTITQRFEKS